MFEMSTPNTCQINEQRIRFPDGYVGRPSRLHVIACGVCAVSVIVLPNVQLSGSVCMCSVCTQHTFSHSRVDSVVHEAMVTNDHTFIVAGNILKIAAFLFLAVVSVSGTEFLFNSKSLSD